MLIAQLTLWLSLHAAMAMLKVQDDHAFGFRLHDSGQFSPRLYKDQMLVAFQIRLCLLLLYFKSVFHF